MPSEQGQSAVVVPAPAAEPLVSAWRERFDPSAAHGMPAHLTTLYPFLPEEALTPDVVARLRVVCAAVPVLDVEFRRTARFPGVLYLEPEPAGALRDLTAAVAARWPEAPPYGGAFDTVIPHLTIAHGASDGVLDEIEAALRPRLPIDGAALGGLPVRLRWRALAAEGAAAVPGRPQRRIARSTTRDGRRARPQQPRRALEAGVLHGRVERLGARRGAERGARALRPGTSP